MPARCRLMIMLVLCLGAPLSAQESERASASGLGSVAPNELVQQLLDRIENLEKRIAELESRQGLASPQPAPTPTAPAAPAMPMPDMHPELAAQGAQEYPVLSLRGFSDVTFSARDPRAPDDGFRLGQFIAHFSSVLSPRVSFIGETSFTAQPGSFSLDVERAVIKYSYNDHLKVSFGRYHTPISYWNTAYHHGLWLQTTVARPEMIQFGGRILPVHFVGLLLEGAIPSGRAGLMYNVGLGNGRGLNIARSGDAGDVNGHRAWLVNVHARPPELDGFQAGGAWYRDLVTTAGFDVDERIATAHVAWTRERPEVIAEFADVRHEPRQSPEVSTRAFYLQLGYRLPQLRETLKPYYRYERVDTGAGDPLLEERDLFAHTLGLRYDITHFAAFKGEYRRLRERRGAATSHAFLAQTSFVF